MLERIFHLYFTTKSGGSGIGLAMSWRIVQMMGGNHHSRVLKQTRRARDRGTLFTVKFPLAVRPASNTASVLTAGVQGLIRPRHSLLCRSALDCAGGLQTSPAKNRWPL